MTATARLLDLTFEDAAAVLDLTDDYRVLRKLDVKTTELPEPDEALRLGLFADVEATSLDTETANIIELALVPFMFTPRGAILLIGSAYDSFNDPGIPIPDDVQMLTGITDETVQGASIDWTIVRAMVKEASLVICHKASYDRPILERHCDVFATKPFACSMEDVGWRATFDAPCRALGHLLQHVCGRFHDPHRAADDCYAGVQLLAAGVRDGKTAMAYLLESARSLTVRLYAEFAPFDVKDALKARGYRWNPDYACGAKKPGVWWKDVKAADEEAERAWLRAEAFCTMPGVKRFTAKDRYSIRAT